MSGRRGVSLRACGALLALASGCDYVFRIDRVPGGGDAAFPDARRPDEPGDAGEVCAGALFHDPFDGPGVCSPWGSSYADLNATTAESGGALVITPSDKVGSVGGCVSQANLPFGGGVTAVVTDVLRGIDTYTVLQVHGPELQIKATGDGFVRFQTSASQDLGVAPYSPEFTRWRIRPTDSLIIGEMSSDGTTWLQLGIAQVTPPAMVGIELSAGTNALGVMGTGRFDELTICP